MAGTEQWVFIPIKAFLTGPLLVRMNALLGKVRCLEKAFPGSDDLHLSQHRLVDQALVEKRVRDLVQLLPFDA